MRRCRLNTLYHDNKLPNTAIFTILLVQGILYMSRNFSDHQKIKNVNKRALNNYVHK